MFATEQFTLMLLINTLRNVSNRLFQRYEPRIRKIQEKS